jgi:hypothetical protein
LLPSEFAPGRPELLLCRPLAVAIQTASPHTTQVMISVLVFDATIPAVDQNADINALIAFVLSLKL